MLKRLLNKRRAELVSGTHLEGAARKIPMSELLDGLTRDYRVNGKDHVWCEGVVRNRLLPGTSARCEPRVSDTITSKSTLSVARRMEHRTQQSTKRWRSCADL